MSEDRMARIEAALEALAGEVRAIRAEMATKQDTAAIRAEIANTQDFAGVAKNVDNTSMCRQLRELLAMKDDVAVLRAIVQRLENTMARQMSDLTEVRAEHSRMDRLLDRVRALEGAQP
jgi:tRNA C32,U32 (ribose-2'-O)-methylase TrmJ